MDDDQLIPCGGRRERLGSRNARAHGRVVVGDVNQVHVLFPAFRGGQVIAERDYYRQRVREQGILGRVKARDPQADLALIQLDKVPEGIDNLNVSGGEPTLRRDLHEIMDVLYAKAKTLEISSNGRAPRRSANRE